VRALDGRLMKLEENMVEKSVIEIGSSARVEVWRDGDWTILYVEDGSGSKATINLTAPQAAKLAKELESESSSTISQRIAAFWTNSFR
jgi:hypothetical protein